ncbi:MAG: MTH938/NDUFAF3 family protein [Anaerolineae bacterium]
MGVPEIKNYRFGEIVVDGETHSKDLIILPDRVVGGWWRESGHTLQAADLEAVFEAGPEVLVVGRGAYGRMRVPDETKRTIEEQGIKLIAHRTKEAVETYNEMRTRQAVAAALHLTC